ncbi:MAG TPA: peptide chain release factor N(5)-glutamine methyltransferase [Thermoanaerobaculia bacterium]|nr:peptide chain release factor N(5)-glutamine methyltransferase [Thermoanaerobaculia bacterium]
MPDLAGLRSRHREDALRRGISPRDVDLLLGDVLGKSLGYLIAHGDATVTTKEIERFELLLARRHAGEPLQYIRGRAEFFGRDFLVDDRVLIPRPETEVLVEAALARAPRGGRIADVGTGSGCIAITIERERPDLRVTATDCSVGALALASRNAFALGSCARFVASDTLAALDDSFDLIISNPPYIPSTDVDGLATEVRDHEPRIALTPGPRGTEVIERILDQAATRLAPAGLVILEIGYGQEPAIRALARDRGWRPAVFLPDLAGIPRVVVLSRDTNG